MRKTLLTLLMLCLVPAVVHAEGEQIVPQSEPQIKLSFAPIVKKVSPAVVNIYTKRVVTQAANPFMNDPFFSQFFGGDFGMGLPRQRMENSLGSGVIVSADGLVVTNAHVVKNSSETKVILSDAREFDAKLVLLDEASDIALLRIAAQDEVLPFATLQPSETLEVGDLVIAIGNPFGVGQTVTSGIVSALARSTLNISDLNFFIQTDAAINPGNSGGPLVAMNGGIVGINSAIYSRDGGSLGIGFAIPSEMVATVIAAAEAGQVTSDHGIKRPWIGIEIQDLTADLATSLGLKRPIGALISNLHTASPARDAGIVPGDVITGVNSRPIRDGAELRFRLAMIPLGQSVKLDYMHKGEQKTGDMKTIAPPETPARDVTRLTGKNPLSGMTVMNLNPAAALELGLHDDEGVVIKALAPRSQISNVVRVGEIVAAVNGKPVKTVADLKKALDVTPRSWSITLSYDGQQRELVIR